MTDNFEGKIMPYALSIVTGFCLGLGLLLANLLGRALHLGGICG